jgi:hypothetical protein
MKFWTVSLTVGICLMLASGLLMAQAGGDVRGPGGRGPMAGRGPSRGDSDQPRNLPPRDDEQGPRPDRPPHPPHRGPGPLLFALDTDRDGVLSAAEIAAASENLKKLDHNEDGVIDRVELRPPPPPRQRGDGEGEGGEDGCRPRRGPEGEEGDGPPRRPRRGDDDEGEGDRRGPRGPGRRRPPPPHRPGDGDEDS